MTEDLQILGELIAEQAAHMDAAEHRLLTNIREFDRLEGWGSAASCAHWLSWRVGWTLGTARDHVRVAKALGSLPHIDEALRVGKVSYCKVRAMTRVATPENEQVLLMDAELTTGSQLERICRKYRQVQRYAKGANPADDDRDRYLRRRDLDNGMVSIEAVCHPEEAALLWAAIDQATKELYAARKADTSATRVSAEAPGDGTSLQGRVADTRAVRDSAGDVSAEQPADHHSNRSGLARPHRAADALSDVSAEPRDGGAVGALGASGAIGAGGAICAAGASGAIDTHDEDDSYEDDCAFFERFGVEPEPRREPVLRREQDSPWQSASRGGAVGATRSTPIVEAPRPRFSRIDGLIYLMNQYVCGESSKKPVEIVVTVAADALAKGAAGSDPLVALVDGEACITAETARRMSCDAGIVHMIEDAHGNPLSVGRRTRAIPASIQRALVKRDTCCRFPGCTNRVFVEGHHIEHWADGGETALSNLALLCTRHHRFVHEYGYRIEVDGDGQLHFFDPAGRPAKDVPTRILRDDLGWPHIVAANSELGIEPHACKWDGERISYDDVCRTLYRLDEGTLKPDDVI